MLKNTFPFNIYSLLIFFAIMDNQAEARRCCPHRKPKCPLKTFTSSSPGTYSTSSSSTAASSSSSAAAQTYSTQAAAPVFSSSVASLSSSPLPPSSSTALPPSSPSALPPSSSSALRPSSSTATTISKVTESKTITALAATTKLQRNCTPAECHCSCEIPEEVKNGTIYGHISLNGIFDRSTIYQCHCTQPSYYSTIFVPASKTSVVSEITEAPQIRNNNVPVLCKNLCMLSEDGIYYKADENLNEIIITYYCDNNNDPKSCAFYALLLPGVLNPRNVTNLNPRDIALVSDDGKDVYQNEDNTEALGQTSSYLKILGASCAGCCDLRAMNEVPSCIPTGVFNLRD